MSINSIGAYVIISNVVTSNVAVRWLATVHLPTKLEVFRLAFEVNWTVLADGPVGPTFLVLKNSTLMQPVVADGG